MASGQPSSGRGIAVRTVLWVLIAIVFLYSGFSRINLLHQQGRHVSSWLYVQVGIWLLALVFWIYVGIRDWKRRLRQREG